MVDERIDIVDVRKPIPGDELLSSEILEYFTQRIDAPITCYSDPDLTCGHWYNVMWELSYNGKYEPDMDVIRAHIGSLAEFACAITIRRWANIADVDMERALVDKCFEVLSQESLCRRALPEMCFQFDHNEDDRVYEESDLLSSAIGGDADHAIIVYDRYVREENKDLFRSGDLACHPRPVFRLPIFEHLTSALKSTMSCGANVMEVSRVMTMLLSREEFYESDGPYDDGGYCIANNEVPISDILDGEWKLPDGYEVIIHESFERPSECEKYIGFMEALSLFPDDCRGALVIDRGDNHRSCSLEQKIVDAVGREPLIVNSEYLRDPLLGYYDSEEQFLKEKESFEEYTRFYEEHGIPQIVDIGYGRMGAFGIDRETAARRMDIASLVQDGMPMLDRMFISSDNGEPISRFISAGDTVKYIGRVLNAISSGNIDEDWSSQLPRYATTSCSISLLDEWREQLGGHSLSDYPGREKLEKIIQQSEDLNNILDKYGVLGEYSGIYLDAAEISYKPLESDEVDEMLEIVKEKIEKTGAGAAIRAYYLGVPISDILA